MNISCCLAALLLLSSAHGWTCRRMRSPFAVTRLSMSSEPKAEDDPCWQDLYDDDCSMSSAYSANFVAGKWVKSMPCASALDEVRYECWIHFFVLLRLKDFGVFSLSKMQYSRQGNSSFVSLFLSLLNNYVELMPWLFI